MEEERVTADESDRLDAPSQLILRRGRVDLIRLRLDAHDGEGASLTPQEGRLLAYLAARSPRLVNRDELLEAVWGYRPGIRSRTVESTMHNLRAKVEHNARRPDHLITCRGRGYRFVPLPDRTQALLAELCQIGSLDPSLRAELALIRIRALSMDSPEQALALLQQLTIPESPQLWLLRARLRADLGRLAEAEDCLAVAAEQMPGPSHSLALERAVLACRMGQTATRVAHLQVAAQASDPQVRGLALVRLGSALLDYRQDDEGYRVLEDADTTLDAIGAARIQSHAVGELGLYKLLDGVPEEGRRALERAVTLSVQIRNRYSERMHRAGLALALRVLGETERADRERTASEQAATERWEEPGVFLFRALERRIAGDTAQANADLAAGLRRHQARPQPADAAALWMLQATWRGREDAHVRELLRRDASPRTQRMFLAPHRLPPRLQVALRPLQS